MGFFDRLFGFRWSLYVVRGAHELVYVMHENNVLRMVGYVMHYFANGAAPQPPWTLHLNFNRRHQSFPLRPEHFTSDGENVTSLLLQQIEAIDPGWKVPHAEPVFMEAATKKRIPMSSNLDFGSFESRMHAAQGPKQVTFYSVMDEVFGRARV